MGIDHIHQLCNGKLGIASKIIETYNSVLWAWRTTLSWIFSWITLELWIH
jgi:hypothetical protein